MNYEYKEKIYYDGCWATWRLRRVKYTLFRYDPVPGSGRRFRLRKSFRYPATQNERRLNGADMEYVRGRRHPVHLPTVWDDIWKCTTQTWKRHRKKQWKKIANIETHWK